MFKILSGSYGIHDTLSTEQHDEVFPLPLWKVTRVDGFSSTRARKTNWISDAPEIKKRFIGVEDRRNLGQALVEIYILRDS